MIYANANKCGPRDLVANVIQLVQGEKKKSH